MKKLAGYLTCTTHGLEGERGLVYDYILAQNGVFLEARSPLLAVRICLTPVLIRGLAPLEEKLCLVNGRIPGDLFWQALAALRADPYREGYLAITWDKEYRLQKPAQASQGDRVDYSVLPNTLVDIHSHGAGDAFFSQDWDNPDEQGFRLSLVIGKLHTLLPEFKMRLVLYGYYAAAPLEEVFECIS